MPKFGEKEPKICQFTNKKVHLFFIYEAVEVNTKLSRLRSGLECGTQLKNILVGVLLHFALLEERCIVDRFDRVSDYPDRPDGC